MAQQENPVQISTGGGSFVLTLSDQNSQPLENVRASVFTGSGTYIGEYANTDGEGKVSFNLADGSYKLRIDYLGYQYWTDVVTVPASSSLQYVVNRKTVTVKTMTNYNSEKAGIANAKAYLFTADGSYMNLSGATDAEGNVSFTLPPRDYKVRIDYLGGQYWSDTINQQDTEVDVAMGMARVILQSNAIAAARRSRLRVQ